MEVQNKVEKSHIDAMVASLEFKFARVEGTTITGCWAMLPNGWKAGYGESSCVIPAEFNKKDGEKYARERAIQAAINKLWENEGYLLKMTGRTSDKLNFGNEILLKIAVSGMGEFEELVQALSDNRGELPSDVLEAIDKFVGEVE